MSGELFGKGELNISLYCKEINMFEYHEQIHECMYWMK